jgi:purine-cytosine permease-like protein
LSYVLLPKCPQFVCTAVWSGLAVAVAVAVAVVLIFGLAYPVLFLGIATPPICGIYIADYLANRRKGYDEARLEIDSAAKQMTFVAWGVASFIGFCTVNGWFTLTGIPSVDSILVAFVGYFMFSL